MLIRFEVENFKNFKEKTIFDLSASKYYEFNKFVISNSKYINKGIIFGENASGKSNLGLAIFDIVASLTNFNIKENKYSLYHNLDSNNKEVKFKYTFSFDESILEYEYSKTKLNEFLYEKILIDNDEIIYYNFKEKKGFSKLLGTETLQLSSSYGDDNISRIKYIFSTAVLIKNKNNDIFIKFRDFVNKMLLFYSLEDRAYQGFSSGSKKLNDIIFEYSSVKEFENFLKSLGIKYDLIEKEINGEKQIYSSYKSQDVPFFDVISTGTSSLTLFYCWFLMMSTMSFVFIDEFDAFYHFDLSKNLVKLLCENLPNTQIFLTTHNTDIISNDLLRPDCYFKISNNKINTFENLTDKDIKYEHNLQKMYKGGAFNE